MTVIVSATMPKRLIPKASFVLAVDKSISMFLYPLSLTSCVSVGVMGTLAGISGGGGISSSSCWAFLVEKKVGGSGLNGSSTGFSYVTMGVRIAR